MFRYIAAAMGVLMLSGCVSTKIVPLKQDLVADLQGGSIVTTRRAKPDFSAMTAGKAMFGLIGAAAMISSGNSIVAENEIEDPARYIGEKLVASFEPPATVTLEGLLFGHRLG